ncbi:MAG: TonB-dependent receptor [Desulfuromonadales bacterium]
MKSCVCRATRQHRHSVFRMALLTLIWLNCLILPSLAELISLPEITVSASPWQLQSTEEGTELAPQILQSLQSATSDTASLFNYIPGVSMQKSGAVSSLPILRGLGDDRVRIKVDGMDLISACGNHMNPPLSYIDPTNVGSAKVYAGITPVSLGGDSIGGTILIDSPAAEFALSGEGLLRQGEVGAFYRSNGNAYGGNVGASVASENFSLSYRGSAATADNYKAGEDFKPAGPAAAGRDSLDADEVGSTMYEAYNHSVSMAMIRDNHLAELKLGLQSIPEQGWPNQRMDMIGNDSKQANLRYEGDYDLGQIEARAYYERTRHEMQFGDDKLFWYGPNPSLDGIPCTPSGGMTGCAAGMPMDTRGENTGLTLKLAKDLSAQSVLRLGAESQFYRLDDWWEPSGRGMWPDTFDNINDGERDRLALFSEWEAQWNTQWKTLLGARAEQVKMDTGEVQGYNATYAAESAVFNAADRSKTDYNVDVTALTRFTPGSRYSVEFGFARKTRSPNLYERYAWSTGGMAMRMINFAGDGNGYVGNLDLEPEDAHTVSAALEMQDKKERNWHVKLAPYYTYVDDYIDAARCSSTNANCGAANQTASEAFVYLQFVNQSAEIYGADLSAEVRLAEQTRVGDFSIKSIVSYTRGKNDTTGDNLYNIMPLNAKLATVQSNNGWTNTVELELVDAKTDVSAVRNELETSGYGLVHLRSQYQWDQASLDFGIENLFDRFYNHPLGGAYTGQGKTMSATDVAWGTPVPGMGRSFYAGFKYLF